MWLHPKEGHACSPGIFRSWPGPGSRHDKRLFRHGETALLLNPTPCGRYFIR